MAEELDYRKLGLRVGLEIHQQLDTRSKLFCGCPTLLEHRAAGTDGFERRLRPTKSELGEVDIAALFEWKRGRVYRYIAPRGTACLVEADEEPPHELSREALVVALAVAMALHAKPLDEVYVMRKIVIDGSNTTGFQRTALIAMGGYVEIGGKRIRIQTVCLEEDAARKVGEEGSVVTYNLDRLGIPLIEIATAPDITSPEEAEMVARKIGQILRLTKRVKRGIGTIRQDLNVSIRDGARIEIKGVQQLDLVSKVVKYEVLRQRRLLEIREELRRRGVSESELRDEMVDVSEVFKRTSCRVIKRSLSSGGRVYAVLLPKFSGILAVELQPGRRFGTELSDYARFWGGVGGIFHSDELPAYGISQEEVDAVYKLLGGVKGRDAFVLIADKADRAIAALKAVVMRAREALKGVPPETRAANPDGTTRYMRPQPGAARMYPETDIPPIEVTEEILAEASRLVPEPPEVKVRRFMTEYGLSKQLAEEVLRDVKLDLFEELAEKYKGKVPPSLIASIMVNTLRSLKREGVPVDNVDEKVLSELLEELHKGTVAKEAIPDVLRLVAENPGMSIGEALSKLGLSRLPVEEIERIVDDVIEECRDVVAKKGERAMGLIMGKVMARVRGRADGRIVASIVRDKLRRR